MTAVNEDDVRYLQRRQRFLSMDVHATACTIVVKYAVEAACLGDAGDYVMGDRKEFQKLIKLKSMDSTINIPALCDQVVRLCRVIPPIKVPELTQLLKFLQKRHKDDVEESAGQPPLVGDSAHGRSIQEFGDGFMEEPFEEGKVPAEEAACLEDIEAYIEMLYEDKALRIAGTGYILQLCRNPDNLGELVENDTLLSALSRVLREDWKGNTQLAINIIYCFFCFSTYSRYHPIIMQHKIGIQLLEATEYEVNRYHQWMKLLADKKKKVDAASKMADSPEQVAFAKFQGQVQSQVRLQDKFLRVALYLLLNLAEDLHTEAKMVRKDLITHLLILLERNNIELLILVMSFVKKLSVIRQNKDTLTANGIVKKIGRLFECHHDVLINMSLRTLINLSFDPAVCQNIVKARLLQKIVLQLDSSVNQTYALCLLYQLSIHNKHKSLFAYVDCVPKLVQMVVEQPGNRVSTELGALCVNLALHPRNAELMCGVAEDGNSLTGQGLLLILKRALKTEDPVLIKVVRNISIHSNLKIRQLFVPFVADIGRVMMTVDDQECLCDILGILSNLTFGHRPTVDADSQDAMENQLPASEAFSPDQVPGECYQCLQVLVSDCDVLDLMLKKLSTNVVAIELSDDAGWETALEPLLLCVALAHDDECALAMAHSGLIDVVATRLNGHQDDDEIVLQTTYFFYLMLLHLKTREYSAKETQIPHILIELMHDPNKEVKRICNASLDIVQEQDAQWAASIQEARFLHYNGAWLEQLKQNVLQEEINEAEERLFASHLDMAFEASALTEDYGQAGALPSDASMVAMAGGVSGSDTGQFGELFPHQDEMTEEDVFQEAGMYSYSQQAELLGQPQWP